MDVDRSSESALFLQCEWRLGLRGHPLWNLHPRRSPLRRPELRSRVHRPTGEWLQTQQTSPRHRIRVSICIFSHHFLPKPEIPINISHFRSYNIMKHCWNADAEARVTFVQLKTAFSELLDVFTNPSGAPVPVTRERLNTPTSREFQRSPVPHPRTRGRGQQLQQNWYSNRPIQIPNLYLNV